MADARGAVEYPSDRSLTPFQHASDSFLSNPAVTAVIPGTDEPEHIVDNMGAGRGEFPDADLRRRIEQIFGELGV